jgi:tetratricopeptide (TPR) repeat protein
MLPRYCIYSQMFRERIPGGNDPALIARWYEYMGPTYHHIHHYCLGLMKANRGLVLARDADARRFYLENSIIEFEYVITKAEDNFVLMPEMLTKKGESLVLLGRGPLGVLQFERAIEVKSDYSPAYAQLSDYYKASGDAKKAREVLESGLACARRQGAAAPAERTRHEHAARWSKALSAVLRRSGRTPRRVERAASTRG